MHAQNRIEAVLDMLASLARLGVKAETLHIEVEPESWHAWQVDALKYRNLVLRNATNDNFIIHGPCLLIVRVSLAGQ